MQPLLYSVNTWLAFQITEKYFFGEHYVWCNPRFDGADISPLLWNTPRSSTPRAVAAELSRDISTSDHHSAKIAQNRAGILTGAKIRHDNGLVSDTELADIASIVEVAELRDFAPLLYVIVISDDLSKLIVDVSPAERAHPLSDECKIERLPRRCFDVLPLGGLPS